MTRDYAKLNQLESQILSSPAYLSGSLNPEIEKTFLETLTNISTILGIEETNIPQSFLSYELQKDQIKERYSLGLEEKNLKKQSLENNLIEYNSKLELTNSELLRQQKLLSELYKTLARDL